MKQTGGVGIKLLSLAVWVMALIHLYPILVVIFSAVKTKKELAINPFGLPKSITFEYFITAFNTMHYIRSLFNTATIAFLAVGILIILSSMSAYAIARKNNRFYNGIYMFFLAGLIVPFQMTMIPLYKVLQATRLISTFTGMICFYLAFLSPFSVFLLTGFVKTVPKELEEAARIDGCSLYGTFYRIVFPLLKPALSTVVVLNLFYIWNDFLAPMLYLQKGSSMTLTVQLNSFRGMYFNDWSLIFTGVCMIVGPMLLIYLFAQRFIISGITAGAVKG